eukprot:CAMPEP_0174293956 /NCGR_PEP_ID=MMETSP0809-20121228/40202_1 /TAXON_ID=73025 ORGANISM="Eutreptiella gymnastica-like, Strain CCMP1594" /NCGR_SAMPLE_ID=MMETSP0809 /ASSEMBLY_ACC=CAM_ASM_000658 /LENGTH=83 /DNA_ID=CAMNT_0015395085 /DNA_START=29 /DNA_END=280 /DNA_ORIENTATION=+
MSQRRSSIEDSFRGNSDAPNPYGPSRAYGAASKGAQPSSTRYPQESYGAKYNNETYGGQRQEPPAPRPTAVRGNSDAPNPYGP